MNIHEFGKENKETILMIHPSVVKWDYFENIIPLLQKKYHLPVMILKMTVIIPAWKGLRQN